MAGLTLPTLPAPMPVLTQPWKGISKSSARARVTSTISVGRDVALLNQFATIYTAGSQVGDPTLGATFDTPRVFPIRTDSFRLTPAQYSSGGGNVTVFAQNDILHETRGPDGSLIPDSERGLPTSWLYRRGYVDPSTGEYGVALLAMWLDFVVD